eukprot:4897083-Prymnesium_polylepis.1
MPPVVAAVDVHPALPVPCRCGEGRADLVVRAVCERLVVWRIVQRLHEELRAVDVPACRWADEVEAAVQRARLQRLELRLHDGDGLQAD